MSSPLILACLWGVIANFVTLRPEERRYRRYWRNMFILFATGIPILGMVTWQNGPWFGLLALAGGVITLRWPLTTLGHRRRDRLTPIK